MIERGISYCVVFIFVLLSSSVEVKAQEIEIYILGARFGVAGSALQSAREHASICPGARFCVLVSRLLCTPRFCVPASSLLCAPEHALR